MTTPSSAPPNEIDITNLVNFFQTSFITYAVNYVYTLATTTAGLTWLALPVISGVFKWALELILEAVANDVTMEAFFLNTAIKKASEAQDYLDAVNTKNNLPTTATEAQIAQAEQNEMVAFKSLVVLTE